MLCQARIRILGIQSQSLTLGQQALYTPTIPLQHAGGLSPTLLAERCDALSLFKFLLQHQGTPETFEVCRE